MKESNNDDDEDKINDIHKSYEASVIERLTEVNRNSSVYSIDECKISPGT